MYHIHVQILNSIILKLKAHCMLYQSNVLAVKDIKLDHFIHCRAKEKKARKAVSRESKVKGDSKDCS